MWLWWNRILGLAKEKKDKGKDPASRGSKRQGSRAARTSKKGEPVENEAQGQETRGSDLVCRELTTRLRRRGARG